MEGGVSGNEKMTKRPPGNVAVALEFFHLTPLITQLLSKHPFLIDNHNNNNALDDGQLPPISLIVVLFVNGDDGKVNMPSNEGACKVAVSKNGNYCTFFYLSHMHKLARPHILERVFLPIDDFTSSSDHDIHRSRAMNNAQGIRITHKSKELFPNVD